MKKVQLNGELFVTKKTNKNGNTYIALMCDLGYTKKALSFNASDIAELLGMSVVELYNITENGGK